MCIALIDKRLHGFNLRQRPTITIHEAINQARDAMVECRRKLGWPISRQIAIIDYHARNRDAEYFDDPYTMNALKVAIQALEWKMGYRSSVYEPVEMKRSGDQ
jgi:hypothetical protein